MPKIKNIIIFTVIGTIFILIYIFFIKKAPDTSTLISSSPSLGVPNTSVPGMVVSDNNSPVAKEFLALLLSVKSIKLDDAIFSSVAFNSLYDSSITLTPDGNEGRPNPFAPFGADNIVGPVSTPIPQP